MPAGHALRVVATAGHVDHGKSSLILRLTGIDPDRWEEEKRRGLTIDLGYAWCTLPSGREIGFVDVPGHERFIRNMLAGVGPVRLILFVVAADEGWKPQSEEHLAIVDVLGAAGAVVALTKVDMVDDEVRDLVVDDVRERMQGTALQDAPIVPCSSATGEGLEDVRSALDAMIDAATLPGPTGRPRLFVDRVFTIKGAGTVVTGTLTGECLTVGDEVELYPTGQRARIRTLQTHKRTEDRACPVSRVAANLVGAERTELERGEILGYPGQWRITRVLDARLRPVRGLGHPLTGRGAYKLYAGAAEIDAQVRFHGATAVDHPEGAFARFRLREPAVLDVFDRFVLREAGRRQTVAGGVVLDVDPPARPGPHLHLRLAARETAVRDDLPRLLVDERGAVRTEEATLLTGSRATGGVRVGDWLVNEDELGAVERAVTEALAAFHRDHPLEEGADLALAREAVADAIRPTPAPSDRELVDALLADLAARGLVIRTASKVRLAIHHVTLSGREDEVRRLVDAVTSNEASPPTVPELAASGFPREVIEAAARSGALVKISNELVLSPGFVARAQAAVRSAAKDGITVSAFREQLGTTRKYAVPLLEHFDRTGVTRRDGDLRFPR